MEVFAQCVIVGTIGLLTAAAFLTIGWDRRLWFLLALGPALAAIARRAQPDSKPTDDEPPPALVDVAGGGRPAAMAVAGRSDP